MAVVRKGKEERGKEEGIRNKGGGGREKFEGGRKGRGSRPGISCHPVWRND
jgi:hypothetical protein